MKKLFLAAVMAVALKAETLCGLKFETKDADVVIACIKVDVLRGLGIPIPPGTVDHIQVFVYSRVEGRGVEVVLPGVGSVVTHLAPSQAGGLAGLATFDGIEHQTRPEVYILDRK